RTGSRRLAPGGEGSANRRASRASSPCQHVLLGRGITLWRSRKRKGEEGSGNDERIVLSHREGASSAAPHASRSQTRKLGWNLFRGTSGMGRGHRGSLTPQDLLLPEGKLIRTTRGAPSALKQLLLDLKKYSFSGYVRT